MLRSALIAAVFLLPSAAMADKIVNPDGDSYTEAFESEVAPGARAANGSPSWVESLSILERLNPVGSANAQTLVSPPSEVRPAADVPEMRNPFLGTDEMMKPDYSAEAFKMAQADPTSILPKSMLDALSTASPITSAQAAPRLGIPEGLPTAPRTYDIGNEFDGYYSKVPGME